MGQLTGPVRPNCATAMLIGIDQGRQHRWTFQGRVESQPQFAQERQIWPHTGRDNQCVGEQMASATSGACSDPQLSVCLTQMGNAEVCFDPDAAITDAPCKSAAERATGGKLVVRTATKSLRNIIAAQNPHEVRFRDLILKPRQVNKRADRRVSASQHGNGSACVAGTIAAENVGHAVGHMFSGLSLADRRQSIRPSGVGCEPGP